MVPHRRRPPETLTPELVLAYRDTLAETRRPQHETLRGRPHHLRVVPHVEPERRWDIIDGYIKSIIGRSLTGLCFGLGIATAVIAWRAFVLSLEAL
ncbi:MAG TPA: hypothetical protein QGF58_08550 [Myxococcota bacterium]|nr:hypothetical protein [Myxococcota bacterium]